MKLEEQITNLELSKKLKELGVKQEGLFWWIEWGDEKDVCDEEQIEYHKKSDYPRVVFCSTGKVPTFSIPPKSKTYSAFTVAELGEILSKVKFKSDLRELQMGGNNLHFWVETKYDSHDEEFISDESEANARAKALIYLIENKLLQS